ncbi:MAG: hypothetical protein LC437_04970 [Thiohalomonas sp.]|nr:hypothetical protein [Thiohalomonas sp.]
MQIDQTLINIILASGASFFTGIIFFWLLSRSKITRLLQQKNHTLQIQYESERKILEHGYKILKMNWIFYVTS